jgi:hypothetical protein
MAMHFRYEKHFHSQLAINGMPLKSLCSLESSRKRHDGSIGVSVRSSIQRMTNQNVTAFCFLI